MEPHSCRTCKHFRQRLLPDLELMSVTADALRIKSEWNAEWRRREHDEWQRFVARDVFLEQPFFYPWCELFTRAEAFGIRCRIDASGRRVRHFALCAAKNPDGFCRAHPAARAERRSRRRDKRGGQP